jgi:hypothetical protein
MSTDRSPNLSQMPSGLRSPGGVVHSAAARAHVKAVRVLETLAAEKGIKLLHFLKAPAKRTAADVAYLCYQTRFLSLFDEIPELHRQFCACASICVFERDDIVFVKGGDADCYYQIADGTAVVKVGAMGGSGTKARLAASSSDIVLGVGAGLGELGLLNKVLRPVGPCVVDIILELCECVCAYVYMYACMGMCLCVVSILFFSSRSPV